MEPIKELQRKVERIESMIFGHDGPGLKETVMHLDRTVKGLDETMSDLRIIVSGLVRFVDETKGEDKAKENMSNTIKWLVGTVIALAIAGVTTIVTILIS